MRGRTLLVAIALAGCVDSSATKCPDGRVCAPGTVCALVTNPDETLCVDASAVAACAGKPDYTRCAAQARCYDGVCLPIVCGNGRVDRADPSDPSDKGEVCDDGNQTSGDGCSADCQSDETCGNGYPDAIENEQCDDGNLVDHDGCDSRCQREQAGWTQLAFGPPSARAAHAAAYDAARGRMLVFSGITDPRAGAISDETWMWNAGWSLVETLPSPGGRAGAAIAYDGARGNVIMFGGNDAGGNSFGDTWLWDGSRWRALALPVAPQPRSGAVMTYDSARQRVVLFGGVVRFPTSSQSNETWEWDGTQWSKPTLSALPPPDRTVGMTYDPVRGRVVLLLMGTAGMEVYEYDGTGWQNVTPASGPAPAIRHDCTFTWDPLGRQIILFGGYEDASSADVGDTWAWTGTAWRSLTPSAAPAARSSHTTVVDLDHGRLLLWGGDVADPDVWAWNGSTWLDLPAAVPVLERRGTTATYDARRDLGIVLQPPMMWEFDGETLLAVPAGAPTGSAQPIVYDEALDRSVMFDGSAPTTWSWDGTAWSSVASPEISMRDGQALAYDAARERVVMFGGYDELISMETNDTFTWDGTGWTKLAPAARPPPRGGASLAYDRARGVVVVFGGAAEDGSLLADTWTWDGMTWTQRTPTTSPPARSGGSLAWDASRARLVLFGGRIAGNVWVSDAWEWTGDTWQYVPAPAPPPARADAALFGGRYGLVVFGGGLGIGVGLTAFFDTWRLRWDGADSDDTCRDAIDRDGDALVGCSDRDCWAVCTPLCPPETDCLQTGPTCGDGTCDSPREDCRSCPADCTCGPLCGDQLCETGETQASCPGDCP
ncbi:MAG: hypothetical protein ACM31C_34775 [Acidobacteriota bacterium]